MTTAIHSLLQDESVPVSVKLSVASGAAILAAFWQSFTSLLAVALAVFFLADVVMGVLVAVHKRGVHGFDWVRFWRAWLKLGAAIIGVVLFVMADLVLHETGVPGGWMPLTSASLTAMCWGFFWSALQNFTYFWPAVGASVEAALDRVHPSTHALRRSTDPKPETMDNT